MSINAYTWIERSLETIHRADWYRSVKALESLPGPTVILEGQELINFASNDYLGLAGEQQLINAAITATQKFGTGTTGSRLLTGHRHLHRELELAIASFKQTEDAIVFSSGYLANLGTIAALVGRRDLILSDRYNHSSLKNGAKVSGACILEYQHNDSEDLRKILQKYRHQYRKSLIITDSVFSMDGDLCSLPELLELATEYNCMVLVDEAHATGVLGKTGAGVVEYLGCTGEPLIQVGTLSKALGSLGGYVAGNATLIDYLRNRSPSWIYTTGLTPADTAAALEAVKIIQQQPQRREQLWHNIKTLKQLLQEHPGKIASTNPFFESWSSFNSPIFCVHLPNAATALTVGQQLKNEGIFAPAIRPPTVSTSRIRISLMATHELKHLKKLVDVLFSILTKEEVS